MPYDSNGNWTVPTTSGPTTGKVGDPRGDHTHGGIDKGKKAMDVARKRGIKDANGNWALNPQEQAIIDAAIDAGWRP